MIRINLKQKAINDYLNSLKNHNINKDPYHWQGFYDSSNYISYKAGIRPKVYTCGEQTNDLTENMKSGSKTLVRK